MKERPILFSTAMVQALDAGIKTQTRRTTGLDIFNSRPDDFEVTVSNHDEAERTIAQFFDNKEKKLWELGCLYGKPGDLLWVRETFFRDGNDYYYRANGACCEQIPECQCADVGKPKWKPSMHMPKDAARIWLKVVNVRVERLIDISLSDCEKEGIKQLPSWPEAPEKKIYRKYLDSFRRKTDESVGTFDPKMSFLTLWMSINGEGSVSQNPWVWVVEFEKVDAPEQWKPNGVVTTIDERTKEGDFFDFDIDPYAP